MTGRGVAGTVAVAVVCLAAAAACGGGSKSTPTNAPLPSPVSDRTPYPTPQVSGSTYTFGEKGYSIDSPAGWEAQPDVVFDQVNNRFPADAFFAAETVEGIQPSITVSCRKPKPDQATTDAYGDAWRAYLALIVHSDVVPRPVMAAGAPAWAFDYVEPLPEQTAPGEAHEIGKTDVVFVDGGCNWLVTEAFPSDKRADYAPTFEAALASFKVVG